MLLADLVAAAPAPPAPPADTHSGLKAAEALAALLTAESLLFAAFGISIALTSKTRGGLPAFVAQGRLAWCIAGAMFVVGFGAAAAWWDVFTPDWPEGAIAWAECVAIVATIVLEVVLATAIAYFVTSDLKELAD